MIFAKKCEDLTRVSAFVVFVLIFSITTLHAQMDELVEDGFDNDVDGLFDEGLEPIEDELIERPSAEVMEEEVEEVSPIRRPGRINRPTPRTSPRPTLGGPTSERMTTLNFAENVPNPNERLRMDFVQVDIEEVVKFFAERLRKQFIYDPAILRGKITIISPTEVTVEEAYRAFLSAMQIRGYIVYPSGQYLKIAEDKQGKKLPVPLFVNTTPDDEGYVTRIITLKYLNVSDIRNAVRDLVTPQAGDVTEHTPTNTLIITDYASNIRRIIRILNLLDVEGFQEQLSVIPLNYAAAADVARKISEIFPTGPQQAQTPAAQRAVRRRPGQAAQVQSPAQQSVIQKVVADERTNSLIILGSERGVEQVRRFIEQIDVPVEGGDGQIHVYPLQNVSAESISATLAALTTGTRTAAATRQQTPARTPAQQRQQQLQQQQQQQQQQAAAGGTSASLFGGEVNITADVTTNSLVIQASPRDFETLKNIIRKLDVRRRQVFIESVILEASVGSGSEFGTQASGPAFRTGQLGARGSNDPDESSPDSAGVFGFGTLGGESLASSLGGLLGTTALTGLALGFRSGGTVGVPITDGDGNTSVRQVPLLSAIVRLAAQNSNLNVISTPHILATANEEAIISIGEEIPQTTGITTTDGGVQNNRIERIRVATELTITPQINAGDYLTLSIDQKVNEPGERRGLASGQIATITREAKTTAIVRDGQTIVIGGIMRDRQRVTHTKVPFLGDIPILGWLFKSRTSQVDKVNLLLFITPHIINDVGDMNDVFFRKLQERERFLGHVGMKEKREVPISGLSPEQLEMLDPEYVKSLKLYPLRQVPADSLGEEEFLPVIEEETPRRLRSADDFPLIPVMPRPAEPRFEDFSSDVFDEPGTQLGTDPIETDPVFESTDQIPDLPELELPELEFRDDDFFEFE